jgi:hypothetical protein
MSSICANTHRNEFHVRTVLYLVIFLFHLIQIHKRKYVINAAGISVKTTDDTLQVVHYQKLQAAEAVDVA